MLAAHDIRIEIDGRAVTLRPSLGAAMRIENGVGFKAAIGGLEAGSLTIATQVIEAAGDHPEPVAALIREIDAKGLIRLDVLKVPLMALMASMLGLDDKQDDQQQADKKPSKPVPLADHFKQLFEIGTGWLGWTPADTWHATPGEIIAAHKGRVDLLKAIFGSGDAKQETKSSTSRMAFNDASVTMLFAPKPAEGA